MNKSLLTNMLSLLVIAASYAPSPYQDQLYSIGVFSFSGAITNWLAIHMLFEKVPFLYGSGVIPTRFEDFKLGIRNLMMNQFFTKENIERFVSESAGNAKIDFSKVVGLIDYNKLFDALVDTILNSQFGPMLAMAGGRELLAPMRAPFEKKVSETILEMTQGEHFMENLASLISNKEEIDDLSGQIESIVALRLSELTPKLVKEIIQQMIREHLGWLVVWGGVFGGLIGLVSSLTIDYIR